MKKENCLLKEWHEEARKKLKHSLSLGNMMEVPKIMKVVINVGLKEAVSNSKVIGIASNIIEAITSQKPVRAVAKKSIAGFKIREGMPIGVFVTLRGKLMFAFLKKLVDLTLPRVRDFQGVSKKFDGNGNYNLGIKDISVFPEAEASGAMELSSGLNITIVTNSDKDSHGYALLESLGMPFYRK